MGKNISNINTGITADNSDFKRKLIDSASASDSFASKVKGISGHIGTGMMMGIGSGLVGAVGSALGSVWDGLKGGFTGAVNMEQTATSLEVMLGSAEQAQAVLGKLTQFAAATPFEFPELADSTKKLLAFGVATQDLFPALRSIGDIASGVGMPVSELAELFGKAKVSGTLMSEDINQLVGRGIPVIQEFAKQLGVPEGQVKDMASKGKISFANLEQAFTSLTSQGGKFNGMMDKQSGTMGGLLSTLSDGIGNTLSRVMSSLFQALNIKGVISGLIAGIDTVANTIIAVATTASKVLVSVGQTLWGWMGKLWTAIEPTVSAIVSGVGYYWQQMFDTAVGLYASLFNVSQAMWNAIASVVVPVAQWIWDGVTQVWQWGTDLLASFGIKSANSQQGAWGTVVAIIKSAVTFVTDAFNVLAWSIENAGNLIKLAALSLSYGVVKAFNQIIYLFTEAVPYALGYLKRNWLQILTDIASYTETVFKNLGSNLVNLIKNIPALLKGELSIGDIWKPLADGFKSVAVESFQLPQRQVGALEEMLGKDADKLNSQLGKSFDGYMAGKAAEAKAVSDTLKNGAASVVSTYNDAQAALNVAAPDIKAQQVKASDPAAAKAAKGKNENKLIEVGSAEAMKLRFGMGGKDVTKQQLDATKEGTKTLKELKEIFNGASQFTFFKM